MPAISRLLVAVAVCGMTASPVWAQTRPMRPDDLFRFTRIGATAWSPDFTRAAVEIHEPRQWLSSPVPTAEIAIVDAASGRLRVVAPRTPGVIGLFGASWSPDGRSLAFFSVDTEATVHVWVWSGDDTAPRRIGDVVMAEGLVDPPRALWSDDRHVILRLRDPAARNDGLLYFAIQRGRNVADAWQRAREGQDATVSVFDATGGRAPGGSTVRTRLASIDVTTGEITTLALGPVHAPRLSPDRRTVTFREEAPLVWEAPVATFFGADAYGEAIYDPVNWGTSVRHIDARTGASVPAPASAAASPSPAGASADRPSLRTTNDPAAGTTLWLRRPGQPDLSVWSGNTWVREIAAGRAESIAYRTTTGEAATGWVLYPPGHVPGQRLPIVTIVYPGNRYDEQTPWNFDVFSPNFEHPQLFAALGYAVALPSMPEGKDRLQGDALGALAAGVLPFLDVLVERGIADPKRIGVLGQSAGGWATLGLIGTTDRFRTAIASASYSNLVSLYGTFYGQYRYGDAGHAQRAQLLRMLQVERGYYGAGAPPWEQPERYLRNSPLWLAANVQTPLLLVHGDQDFIPIQQAEEFFTALYRQDKRVQLLRYAGEEHTIDARANVLDMWRRFEAWLRETMP